MALVVTAAARASWLGDGVGKEVAARSLGLQWLEEGQGMCT